MQTTCCLKSFDYMKWELIIACRCLPQCEPPSVSAVTAELSALSVIPIRCSKRLHYDISRTFAHPDIFSLGKPQPVFEKIPIYETLNLSTCADSSTNTKSQKNIKKKNLCLFFSIRCQVSDVRCHVSCVTCHLSYVTCHISITPTVTAMDPPPANSPTMHIRMVRKDPQIIYFSAGKLYTIYELNCKL